MCLNKILLSGTGIAALCGFVAFGQGEAVHKPGPTDKIMVITSSEVDAAAQQLAATKKATNQWVHEDKYNFEVRRLVGRQPILMHVRKSDFMVIREGEGTYQYGGKLVDPKPGGGGDEGDMHADSVTGGMTRVLKPGDVIFVPAGLPHGFIEIKDHITFIMTRYDTK